MKELIARLCVWYLRRIGHQSVADPWDQWEDQQPIEPRCPHGEDWGDCDDCFAESDFQADVAREQRMFGRH